MKNKTKDLPLIEKVIVCPLIKPKANLYLNECERCRHNEGKVKISNESENYPAQFGVFCNVKRIIPISDIVTKER